MGDKMTIAAMQRDNNLAGLLSNAPLWPILGSMVVPTSQAMMAGLSAGPASEADILAAGAGEVPEADVIVVGSMPTTGEDAGFIVF